MNTKIFVSHRIDIDSEQVKGDFYCPVKCGAYYDKSLQKKMVGDNSGDNISDKRLLYGELTVQYWAWKNVDADYYGLCHYRRYLSFNSNESVRRDCFSMIREVAITEKSCNRHCLSDYGKLEALLKNNDMIIGEGCDVNNIIVKGGRQESVKGLWEAHDGIFIEKKYIDILFDKIRELWPEYYEPAKEYFASGIHYGFNCYVMRKDLYDKLCDFQFTILFELQEMVINEHYTGMKERTLGYLGEMLYGVFVYSAIKSNKVKVYSTPIVYFLTTTKIESRSDYYARMVKVNARDFLGNVSLILLPRGSRRRNTVKKMFNIR